MLAGCSSAPVARNEAAGSKPMLAGSQEAPRYHYELDPEYSDGVSYFLHLVPDNNP
jgi:hypothetical protein